MRRILFVDDEPSILDGLRRMLRKFASGCEMVFAAQGADALDCCAAAPFDVVVSDARMPGMDGPTLLRQIMRMYPDTARIVLSGQYQWDMSMESVGVAHQFLNKPCDAWALKATLEHVCNARERFGDVAVRTLIGGIETLPSQPGMYAELALRLDRSDASVDKVAPIIAGDVAMCAKTAQLVSSGFFGSAQRMLAGVEAATYLGLETIRALMRSSSIFLPAKAPEVHHELERLNRHSCAVAIAAREIAKTVTDDRIVVGDAYAAGLFHDLGAFALLGCATAPRYANAGISASGYLAALWGLPAPIVDAVGYCRAPSQCPDQDFGPTTAVHVAHALLAHCDDGNVSSVPSDILDMEYLDRTGCSDRLLQWREMCAAYQAEEVLA